MTSINNTIILNKTIDNDSVEDIIENYTFVTVSLEDGTASTPSIHFKNDTNTGIFSSGGDEIGFSAGGSERFTVGSSASTFANNVVIPLTGKVTNSGNDGIVLNDGSVAMTTNNVARLIVNDTTIFPINPIELDTTGSIASGNADGMFLDENFVYLKTAGTTKLTIGPAQITSGANISIPLTGKVTNSENDGIVLTDGSVAMTTNDVARLTATDSALTSTLNLNLPSTGEITNGGNEKIAFTSGSIDLQVDGGIELDIDTNTSGVLQWDAPDNILNYQFKSDALKGVEEVIGDNFTVGTGVSYSASYTSGSTTIYRLVKGDGTSNATLLNSSLSSATQTAFTDGPAYSMAFWYHPNGATANETMIGYSDAAAAFANYLEADHTNGKGDFAFRVANSSILNFTYSVSNDIWQHWAVVWDANGFTVYLNNVDITASITVISGSKTTAWTAPASPITKFFGLHRLPSSSQYSNGYLGPVHFSNTAWSSGEISEIYNNEINRLTTSVKKTLCFIDDQDTYLARKAEDHMELVCGNVSGLELTNTSLQANVNTSIIGNLDVSGNLVCSGSASQLKTNTAGNSFSGKGTLSSGALTVSHNNVKSVDVILVSYAVDTGFTSGNAGILYVSAVVNDTSFTITSTNSSDDNNVAWLIVKANA